MTEIPNIIRLNLLLAAIVVGMFLIGLFFDRFVYKKFKKIAKRTKWKGDEIIVSALEHHSNIVPWQMLCERTGAVLKVIPISLKGELIMEEYDKLLSKNTKLVFVNHVSNALGTINPIK